MTHHDTSTDRDREAIDQVCAWLTGTVPVYPSEIMGFVLQRLRALGWSAPGDEPTEAMVEAALDAINVGPRQGCSTDAAWMRKALVAAAKARGE